MAFSCLPYTLGQAQASADLAGPGGCPMVPVISALVLALLIAALGL